MSIPIPMPSSGSTAKLKLPLPLTVPPPLVTPVNLGSTRREPSKRPTVLMLETTVPVNGLSSRALLVRTRPSICGLARLPLTSALADTGPVRSKVSTPVSRHRLSAPPLNRAWANSGLRTSSSCQRPPPRPVTRPWNRPMVLPSGDLMIPRAAALRCEMAILRPRSTGAEVRIRPDRVRPFTVNLASPTGTCERDWVSFTVPLTVPPSPRSG